MSDFADAALIFAGGSNSTPRNFTVRAGSSILENRDYIVVLKRSYTLTTGVISITSSELKISDFNSIQAEPSTVSVLGNSATLQLFTLCLGGQSSTIQVISANLNILRVVQHATGTVIVGLNSASLTYSRKIELPVLTLAVESEPISLDKFNAYTVLLSTGEIVIDSGALTVDNTLKLEILTLGVVGGTLRTEYGRIFRVRVLPLAVVSPDARLSGFTPTILQTASSLVEVRSSDLTTDIRRYLSADTCTLSIDSGLTDLIYDRIFRVKSHALGVSSGVSNLLFNKLGSSSVNVSSTDTLFGYQYRLELQNGQIEISSSNTDFKNLYLVGATSTVRLISSLSDFRLLPIGYLPSTVPTTRSFQPPSYKIEKTMAFNGRAVRQVMCSKPSEALLNLEYINISDAAAAAVLLAYEESYGSMLTFHLPPEVYTGAGAELLNYIRLTNSSLKWHYADKPSVEAVTKGVCNLNVQLRARIETL